MKTVTELNFCADEVQFYDDSWRRRVRTCVYKGTCPVCDQRMYWFEDGENDPRGPLGDHAATYTTPRDEGLSNSEVHFWYCFLCANTKGNYLIAVDLLKEREKEANGS